MFNDLGERLTGIFGRLRGRGILTEVEVREAARALGDALLEADVAASLVDEILDSVLQRAVGSELLHSITPGQQVATIVHDVLVEALSGSAESAGSAGSAALHLDGKPPAAILMVGLQGVGKTTTSAKLALHLKRGGRKVLLASLDVSRPAAREQLRVLGDNAGIAVLPEAAGEETPEQIARRAMSAGEAGGFAVVILDTAGRAQVDEVSMDEMARIRQTVNPAESLLVVDAMIGQNAATMAREFARHARISGLILTRVDADARGGAALSARHVSGVPIKFMGVGEGLDALQPFHAERIAARILGMGDVASLLEKAESAAQTQKSARARKAKKSNGFDMDDLSAQLQQISGMGGLGGILSMLPGIGGMGRMKQRLGDAGMDEGSLRRSVAIISSMTRAERANPKLFNASRKRRVAAGAGASIQEVNRLLKFHRQINDAVKKSGVPALSSLEAGAHASGASAPAMLPAGMSGLPSGMPPFAFGAGMPNLPAALSGTGGMRRKATKRRAGRKKR